MEMHFFTMSLTPQNSQSSTTATITSQSAEDHPPSPIQSPTALPNTTTVTTTAMITRPVVPSLNLLAVSQQRAQPTAITVIKPASNPDTAPSASGRSTITPRRNGSQLTPSTVKQPRAAPQRIGARSNAPTKKRTSTIITAPSQLQDPKTPVAHIRLTNIISNPTATTSSPCSAESPLNITELNATEVQDEQSPAPIATTTMGDSFYLSPDSPSKTHILDSMLSPPKRHAPLPPGQATALQKEKDAKVLESQEIDVASFDIVDNSLAMIQQRLHSRFQLA